MPSDPTPVLPPISASYAAGRLRDMCEELDNLHTALDRSGYFDEAEADNRGIVWSLDNLSRVADHLERLARGDDPL